ncbi:MAG: DUF802 domain-containing protein [Verrucomicrobiae bacterium]|nr:DUF802 domain-containing protein [Verrucomicrobiae bacterium]
MVGGNGGASPSCRYRASDSEGRVPRVLNPTLHTVAASWNSALRSDASRSSHLYRQLRDALRQRAGDFAGLPGAGAGVQSAAFHSGSATIVDRDPG